LRELTHSTGSTKTRPSGVKSDTVTTTPPPPPPPPPNPLDNILKCFFTESPWELEPAHAISKPVSASLPRGLYSTQPINISWATPKYYLKKAALYDSSFIAKANKKISSSSPYVKFDVNRCVPRGLKEHFPSTDIFLKEIDAFVKCAGDDYLSSLESLDKAIDNCVKVHHGISDQFVYRSMYAAQLYHCQKVK
jgi:hypothetical protein